MNFKKSLIPLAIAGAFVSANAHDFWVNGDNQNQFKAHIGYGHDFPKPEAIPENRTKLFNPLYIVKDNGTKIALKQEGQNYEFMGDKLPKGAYILAGEYKPTFWSKDSDGKWHMDGTRANTKNVEFCELAIMNAKSVISIDGAKAEFINKPIGQKIEIVPLDDPFELKVDKPFKVQVFLDGKPLKTAKVTGTFEGFLQDKHAFVGTTDLKGVVDVMALRPGKWLLEVTHEQPHKDAKVCEQEIIIATLTLEVR